MKWIFTLLFALIISGREAHALNICTMTFNSADERGVLKSVYPTPMHKHIELVPNNKDPQWFKKACQSNVKCDVLLMSGHFGGMFFGEKSSSILGLDEIEKASCQQTCDNILGAKQVYLMGCNTLATKTPDHRSIGQYLQVLVQDGFPRNLAEDVVASRYVNYGLGISERMSLAFKNSSELFGFSSTGPLGAVAAPILRRAFVGKGSTPISTRLKNSFAGTSFRVVNPKSEISSNDISLQCGARSNNFSEKEAAFEKILSSNSRRHFDLVLRNNDDQAAQSALRATSGNPSILNRIQELASNILAQSNILIGARFQVLKVLRAAEIINEDEYQRRMSSSLDQRVADGLDTIVLDQVCSIAQADPNLTFKSKWLTNAQGSDQSYWARLYSCFRSHQGAAFPKLIQWIVSTKNSSTRREILRALKGKWSEADKKDLLAMGKVWSARDRLELFDSLQVSSNSPSCYSGSDDQNWNCFNRLKTSFNSLADCQSATAGFRSESGLGADWYCLQTFNKELHLSACINAGKKYANAEKSDDFLQYCWDQLRTQKAANRSECAGFGQAMRIQGNKIKQNWNCMNQVRDS